MYINAGRITNTTTTTTTTTTAAAAAAAAAAVVVTGKTNQNLVHPYVISFQPGMD
jgi:hypothetical protein